MVLSLYCNRCLFTQNHLLEYLRKPDIDLVMTAFKKAYKKQNVPLDLIFHSNIETQYTAFAFR